jgi:7-cyano-7-deazaguanine synthase
VEGELSMKVVVLASGGVDSSLTMLMLKSRGHEVFPLHVNYGHLAESREWQACQSVCKYLGVGDPVRISLVGMNVIPCGLLDRGLDIEEKAFLPTRNLLFAVLGASYAFSMSSRTVALGILANPIFPDQTPEFVKKTESCISSALGVDMKMLTPLIELDKRDTLRLARTHGLPLELTYYCHSGQDIPCGKCISCKERKFAEEFLSKMQLTNDANRYHPNSVL